MIRFIFGNLAKLPAAVVFVLPVLKFVFNIDWYKDLYKLPIIGEYLKNATVAYIVLLSIIAGIYIISKIILSYIDHKEDNESSNIIHTFAHEVRNHLFDIKRHDTKNSNIENFYQVVKLASGSLCDTIYEFLKSYTNKKFSVCIKLIEPTSSKRTKSKNEIKLITLCRSGNNKLERGAGDNSEDIRLVDNTDFEMIFDSNGEESTNVFAIHNLPFFILQRKLMKKPYKTSSKHPLKNYHSTIVTPIRIENSHLPKDQQIQGVQYVIMGFLCIDYKHIITRNLMKKLKNYIKSMGDSLYVFFDTVEQTDMKLRNEAKNNTALPSNALGGNIL